MPKKLLTMLFLVYSILFFLPLTYAQDESLTITTYYPSPYGVYQNLRLYPSTQPPTCDSNNAGVMYYDQTGNNVMVCGGSPLRWRAIGWGAAGGNLSEAEMVQTTKNEGSPGCSGSWCEVTVICPQNKPRLQGCTSYMSDCEESDCGNHGVTYSLKGANSPEPDSCTGYFDPDNSRQTVYGYCVER